MTDAPQVLLAHHLKALKLPTFLREYDKLARTTKITYHDNSTITNAYDANGNVLSMVDNTGTTTTGPQTSHRYTSTGTFVVRLRVVTTTGQEGYTEITIRV